MTDTMTAAVMVKPKEPLELRQIPIPQPGPGKILVKIEVCGLCHSDLHFWLGEHEMPRDLPAVLGHEGIGRIVKLGAGVSRWKEGDRVGVGYVYGTCGYCRPCLTGHETHCTSVKCTGVDAEGCFAEYAVLREDWATSIPDSLDVTEAAPLLCAGVAAYSATRKAALEPGELAVVFGAGGLGTYAIQLAKSFGARVAAVDVSDDKLSHAKDCGADFLIKADENACKKIRNLGGADASLNFAPVAASWRQMVEGAGPRGRLVLVSLPNQKLTFDAAEVIENGLQVMGSADGSRQELRQLMELAASGRIRSVVERVPFEAINSSFERLAAGEVKGRLVIDMR
ncbi:MAG: zinc-dependent alcohol dehydrogenase [Pseudomonadota bacterium]